MSTARGHTARCGPLRCAQGHRGAEPPLARAASGGLALPSAALECGGYAPRPGLPIGVHPSTLHASPCPSSSRFSPPRPRLASLAPASPAPPVFAPSRGRSPSARPVPLSSPAARPASTAPPAWPFPLPSCSRHRRSAPLAPRPTLPSCVAPSPLFVASRPLPLASGSRRPVGRARLASARPPRPRRAFPALAPARGRRSPSRSASASARSSGSPLAWRLPRGVSSSSAPGRGAAGGSRRLPFRARFSSLWRPKRLDHDHLFTILTVQIQASGP